MNLARARRIVEERQVRQVAVEAGTKSTGVLAVLQDGKGSRRTLRWTDPLAVAAREAGSDARRCFEQAGGTALFHADERQRRKTFELAALEITDRTAGSLDHGPHHLGTIVFPDLSKLVFGPGGTVEITVPDCADDVAKQTAR